MKYRRPSLKWGLTRHKTQRDSARVHSPGAAASLGKIMRTAKQTVEAIAKAMRLTVLSRQNPAKYADMAARLHSQAVYLDINRLDDDSAIVLAALAGEIDDASESKCDHACTHAMVYGFKLGMLRASQGGKLQ